MLDVALDKESYKPGDVAKLRIASKQGGKALIAVLANGLVMSKEVEIAKGGGEVDLQVGDDWGRARTQQPCLTVRWTSRRSVCPARDWYQVDRRRSVGTNAEGFAAG